jgi:hypothetical protein
MVFLRLPSSSSYNTPRREVVRYLLTIVRTRFVLAFSGTHHELNTHDD